jgi:hypothetical protein
MMYDFFKVVRLQIVLHQSMYMHIYSIIRNGDYVETISILFRREKTPSKWIG